MAILQNGKKLSLQKVVRAIGTTGVDNPIRALRDVRVKLTQSPSRCICSGTFKQGTSSCRIHPITDCTAQGPVGNTSAFRHALSLH
jgi:hypothetical protein